MSVKTIPYVSLEFFEEQAEEFSKIAKTTIPLHQIYDLVFGDLNLYDIVPRNIFYDLHPHLFKIKRLIGIKEILPKIYVSFAFKDMQYLIGKVISHQWCSYFDPECEIIQCDAGKMRSFDDLWAICQTYYPDISAKDVMQELLQYSVNQEIPLSFGRCSTMGKIRITCKRKGCLLINDYPTKYNSIYSWNDLFKMVGLEDYEKRLAFLNSKSILYSRLIT